MAHLYASFADAAMAEKAAGALLDFGVRQEDVSLVANDQYGQTRESYTAQTTDPNFAAGATGAYGTEGTAAGYETAGGAAGRNVAVYDNPATPGTGTAGVGTAGLGTAGLGSAGMGTTGMGMDLGSTPVTGDMNPLDQGGPDSAAAHGDAETAAKHGISTTTPEDAGQGAVKGTGIGLGVGILASLAALTIPGVGLVLGGGALAAALGATALTAGAGAVAGGATGYLKEQGIPAEAADRYHGAVSGGGAVLSLSIPSGKVDQATAEEILAKYGAADVNAY